MNLTKAEMKLTAYLLDLAAEVFANHGCGELHLKKSVKLSDEEVAEIQQKAGKYFNPEGYEPTEDIEDIVEDWVVMEMLSKKISKEIS